MRVARANVLLTSMPRYYFDTDDGQTLSTDQEGVKLEGPQAARTEALRWLAGMAREALPTVEEPTFAAVVREQNGTAFFRTSLTLRHQWLG